MRRPARLLALLHKFREDLVLGLVVFALPALLVIRFLVHESNTSIALVMVLPIAIIANERGLRAGVFAATFASTGFGVWELVAKPDGALTLLVTRAAVFFLVGAVVGALADRSRAETRLMRAMLDAIPAPASVKDREGEYIIVNASLRRTLERREDDLVGRPAAHGQPEDVRKLVVEADGVVFEEGKIVSFDVVSAMPDGTRSVHHTIKAPVVGVDGNVDYIVTIAYDVTDRVNEEEAAFAAAAFERTSFERARRDYRQLMRHRLANPLTIIRAAAGTLDSDYAADRETRRQLASLVDDACRRIDELETSAVSLSLVEQVLAADAPSARRFQRANRSELHVLAASERDRPSDRA